MYATRVMNSHFLDPVDFLGLDCDNKSIWGVDSCGNPLVNTPIRHQIGRAHV